MTLPPIWLWILGFILLTISIILEIRHRKQYNKDKES